MMMLIMMRILISSRYYFIDFIVYDIIFPMLVSTGILFILMIFVTIIYIANTTVSIVLIVFTQHMLVYQLST